MREATKRIWVAWETQRRNETLSRELGAQLHAFDDGKQGLSRYLVCLWRTLRLYRSVRADLIFAQNPSLALSAASVLYGKFAGIPVVIDAHNAGLFPREGRMRWANAVAAAIARYAELTIVTNEGLAGYVRAMGGRPFVLPDPLPKLAPNQGAEARFSGKHNVVYVCTYGADEPYREVIEAGRIIGDDVYIYITGNPKRAGTRLPHSIPRNVVLTGFLPDGEYVSMLAAADLVVALTTREDCLLCGAHEAVCLGKPLLTSDRKALRDYFRRGTSFSDNSAPDLAAKVKECLSCIQGLRREMEEFKEELAIQWHTRRTDIEGVFEELAGGRKGKRRVAVSGREDCAVTVSRSRVKASHLIAGSSGCSTVGQDPCAALGRRVPSVSVILPTYNERENIRLIVPRISEVLDDAGLEAEIIVVDDNSPDGTAAVAAGLAGDLPVRVHCRKGERGLATAVMKGFDLAVGEICVVMDADMSHPVEKLPEMVRPILEGRCDATVGTRYIEGGGSSNWSFTRRIISKGAGWLARGVTTLMDPTSGFMAIRRHLLSSTCFDPVGWKIVLEVVAKTRASVIEVPIVFADRQKGESKLSAKVQWEYLRHLLKLYVFRYPRLAQFVKFCLVGLAGVVVDTLVLVSLVEMLGFGPKTAAVFAFLVAVSFNYAFNATWTFRSAHRDITKKYLFFAGLCAVGLGIRVSVMHILIEYAGFGDGRLYVAASLFGIMAATFFNFTGSRYVFLRRNWGRSPETRGTTDA